MDRQTRWTRIRVIHIQALRPGDDEQKRSDLYHYFQVSVIEYSFFFLVRDIALHLLLSNQNSNDTILVLSLLFCFRCVYEQT